MATYSLAQRTTSVATAATAIEIRSTTTDRPRIMEISFSQVLASASVIGLGTPAALGVTPSSAIYGLQDDASDPNGTISLLINWSTAPTVPTNFFRRVPLAATIGAGAVLSFPRGLLLPISSSFVLWNILGGSNLDVSITWDI